MFKSLIPVTDHWVAKNVMDYTKAKGFQRLLCNSQFFARFMTAQNVPLVSDIFPFCQSSL